MSLISYDPSTGTQTRLPIPPVPVDPAANALRPPSLQGQQYVVGLSADGSGHLALALADAADMEILNTANERFSTVALPVDTEATDVAYAGDGTLGASLSPVGSSNAQLMEYSSTAGTSLVSVTSAGSVTALGNGFGLDSGQVVADGSASASELPGWNLLSNSGATPSVGGRVTSISPGNLVVQTTTGFAEVTASGANVFALPQFDCSGEAVPPGLSSSPSSSSSMCAQTGIGLVASSQGVFFVPSGPTISIDYVPLSS